MEHLETPLDRAKAVNEFWSSHDDSLHLQSTLTAVTNLSDGWFERGRWAGYGPRYIKLGRRVRYRKRDVVSWMEKNPAVGSTTEAAEKIGPQFGAPRKKQEQPRGAKPKAKGARGLASKGRRSPRVGA